MQTAQTKDSSRQFVRDTKTSPEPAIVLADDQQLQDMVWFGTSSFEFCIITVDPTFSLGEFDVTPLSYSNLLLETKCNSQPPVFLGPILIHYKKTFVTYLFFASSLVGQCPQLQVIRAFGTDGEKPLIDFFNHEFGFAQHLTYFIHVRRNIKEKLQLCCIPSDVAQQVMNDIFGQRRGTVFEEGIVDAVYTDDFQHKLESLETKWRNLDTSSSSDFEGFLHWFTINKVDVLRNTMLRPVREECGLGCPPAIFTTNASKSLNAVLKSKVDYKKSELPVFIEKIKKLVSEQHKEVERAIVYHEK